MSSKPTPALNLAIWPLRRIRPQGRADVRSAHRGVRARLQVLRLVALEREPEPRADVHEHDRALGEDGEDEVEAPRTRARVELGEGGGGEGWVGRAMPFGVEDEGRR